AEPSSFMISLCIDLGDMKTPYRKAEIVPLEQPGRTEQLPTF
ncbi:hypothetical protein CCACVL1_00886, partial [Corchorus capsularis]